MDLRGVDLNLLVALDALLTEQHVTRAAKRLSVTQPTMSASLARLRRLLDDPLLVRVGGTLQTTPFAESIRVPLAEVLSQVDRMLTSRPRFEPEQDARTFSVMATDYVTLVLLRPLVERLAHEAPHVRLTVRPVIEAYPDSLRRDEMDVLILPREVAGAQVDVAGAPLFQDRFVCVVWQDHPDVGDEITREMLEDLPYLAWRAHGLRSYVDKQLDALDVQRRVEVTTESFIVAPFLLRGTRMIALVQEQLALTLAAAADVRLLEPPVPLEPLSQTLYWHPRRTDDPAHQWFRERIADAASTIGS